MDSLGSHTDYGSVALDEAEADPDPMRQFALWLSEAEKAGVYEPNAMVLSTVDPDGRPSSRTVLLKGLDGGAFEFVTNYGSRKGVALQANSAVSLLFPWYPLHRQVIVSGTATRTSASVSDAYFAARPRGSRLAALASDQSRPVESRAVLEDRVVALEREFGTDGEIPRPHHWGAFRVVPQEVEFWQGRTSRLHDRLCYTPRPGGEWSRERLQP